MRQKSLLILVTAILGLWWVTRPAAAATIEVWPGGPINDLQQALEEAVAGDTIQVHPGRYRGNLVIAKAVSLIGLECPVIDGGGEGDVITVLADGVTLKGFEITGSGKKLENSEAGIKLKSIKRAVIEDCRIVYNLFGIYLDRSEDNTIRRNLIRGRQVKGRADKYGEDQNPYAGYHPSFEGEGGDGIHLFASSGNQVEHNFIVDTRDGIYFNYAQNNRLIGNTISGVRYGIHYMYSDDNYFERNLLTHNVAGAAPMFSKRIVFRENVFAHSRGHRAYGLLFATCDDSLAEGNIIIDNTRGVFFDVSLRNVFRRNLVALNDVGLDLISSSSDNLFVENNFIDNLQQVAMIAGRVGEGNRFFEEGRGNYWNDYRGFDLDRDGIGDVPHKTGDPFTYLMAKAPVVRLFLNSPAAKALEFSEKMFPLIDIPKVEDRYPLAEPPEIKIPEFAYQKNEVNNHVLGLYSVLMIVLALAIFARVFKLNLPRVHRRGYFTGGSGLKC